MIATRTVGRLLVTILLWATTSYAQVDWSAGVGTSQLWTDNVFGTESSPGDGITDGRGWVLWSPAATVQLGASGRFVRFADNSGLNHGYLGATADARHAAPGASMHWDAGLAGSWRLNRDLYAPYNYRDGSAYLGAKHYLSPTFTAQLRAEASARAYPDAPWESARKMWLGGRLQRSLPTRTSLGLILRTGWKHYDAEQQEQAATWEATATAAQSLSARFALRTWGSHSRLYEHGSAASQLAAFENPLLDEFSADGTRLGFAVKAIMPWNTLAELSVERAWLVYAGRPPLLYDTETNEFRLDEKEEILLGPGERSDTSTRVRFDVEKRIASTWGGSRASLRATVGWTDQESNDLYWQWRGWSVQAGAVIEY